MNRTVRFAVLLAVLGVALGLGWHFAAQPAQAQSYLTFTTLADITGDGAAHPFVGSATGAFVIDIVALSTNTGTVRIGDSNVGASRGIPLAPGSTYHWQAVSTPLNLWSMPGLYYFAAVGDKVAITYVH